MKTFRLIMAGIGVVMIGVALLYIDYTDFFSKTNRGILASVLGMVFIIIAMLLSNWEEEKRGRK